MNIRYVRMLHQKCRQDLYPFSNVKRFAVPEERIPWTVDYPEYKPVAYTATVVKGKPWADPEINEPTFKPKWNAVDGNYPTFIRLTGKFRTVVIEKLTIEEK